MRGKKFITHGASATSVILAPANLFNIHTTIFITNKNTPTIVSFSSKKEANNTLLTSQLKIKWYLSLSSNI